jgi:hypothetical protein
MTKFNGLLVCLCAIVCLVRLLPAASKRAEEEPFRTFALIDSRLSELAKQQQALKQALAARNPRSGDRPWTAPALGAQQAAESIRLLGTTQQKRYARLKQSFGIRAFRQLAEDAAAVKEVAVRLKDTQEQKQAASENTDLEKRTLALVLQYQAITGGYGAAHCSPVQRPCCLPKEDGTQGGAVACSWKCVSSAAACSQGFTGPRH